MPGRKPRGNPSARQTGRLPAGGSYCRRAGGPPPAAGLATRRRSSPALARYCAARLADEFALLERHLQPRSILFRSTARMGRASGSQSAGPTRKLGVCCHPTGWQPHARLHGFRHPAGSPFAPVRHHESARSGSADAWPWSAPACRRRNYRSALRCARLRNRRRTAEKMVALCRQQPKRRRKPAGAQPVDTHLAEPADKRG